MGLGPLKLAIVIFGALRLIFMYPQHSMPFRDATESLYRDREDSTLVR